MLGFLLVRPELFSSDDAATTLARLVDNPGLARVGIALELGIVLSQALAAIWFFRLFRPVDAFAAGAIAAFGLVNAVAILASAACVATALQVALEPVGDAGNVQFLYLLSDNLWIVGGLFFGLWLIPMGWLRAEVALDAPGARMAPDHLRGRLRAECVRPLPRAGRVGAGRRADTPGRRRASSG